MARERIRIGLAQVNPVVGDIDGNLSMSREMISRAKKAGVQILAFPELSLCGYPPEDLLLKPSFIGRCEKALRSLAGSARGIAVIAGAPEMAGENGGGALYNTAWLLHRGAVRAGYRKINLPNYGVFDEKRYFTPGEAPVVLDFDGVRVGLSICEDVWVDDGPTCAQAADGKAGIVINISASPYHRRKGPERERLMRRRAKENGVWLCYVNLLGGQDELVFDGSSVICSPDGGTFARARPFEEDLLTADIPARGAKGPDAPCHGPAAEVVSVPALPEGKGRARRRRIERHPGPVEEIYRALLIGTRDYVRKNGFSAVVLGLSGGVDSALTAAVAADALGPDRVMAVTMPSDFTSKGTFRDAYRLASNLGIEIHELPIQRVFESYRKTLSPLVPGEGIGVTEENIQARIRGNLLMALSNRYGWLVLTTGNKSEIAVGYCTLYGDMAGGFDVLKDVPKTMVFSLCRYVNRRAGRTVIPRSTIERRPSAELRPSQFDEDTLPPYPVLDRIIEAYVENDLTPAEIESQGIDGETVLSVVRMIDRSEYKRRQGPPGIKITPRAFGRDRRLPITNRFDPSAAAGRKKARGG